VLGPRIFFSVFKMCVIYRKIYIKKQIMRQVISSMTYHTAAED
jgi:hypothetical protein